MRLTESAINSIDNLQARLSIAAALKCTEVWVGRIIRKNKENGPLTTAAALEVIRKETGLMDKEILEKEPVPAETD